MKNYLNKLRKPMILIDKTVSLNKEDLGSFYSKDNVEALKILLPELVENEFVPNNVTSAVFVEILYKCCIVRKKWGKALGNAIIEADNFIKNNNKEIAIQCLNDFIVNCNAPYFRKHAENQLKFYENHE